MCPCRTPTKYWTTYTYDAAGRTTQVTQADNSQTKYGYGPPYVMA